MVSETTCLTGPGWATSKEISLFFMHTWFDIVATCSQKSKQPSHSHWEGSNSNHLLCWRGGAKCVQKKMFLFYFQICFDGVICWKHNPGRETNNTTSLAGHAMPRHVGVLTIKHDANITSSDHVTLFASIEIPTFPFPTISSHVLTFSWPQGTCLIKMSKSKYGITIFAGPA